MKNLLRALLKPQYVYRPSQLLRRILRGLMRVPRGEVRARLPWGQDLLIQPSAGSVGRSIWYLGVHDLLVCEVLWRLTGPGDLAVDGGANIGQMTGLLRLRVGPRGRVVAFEPHPGAAGVLERNVGRWAGDPRLGSVEVHRVALDATSGPRRLHEGDESSWSLGTASLVAEGARAIEVVAETLDRVFPNETLGILKLDIEGGEERALNGARDALRHGRIRHLVFEADDGKLASLRTLLEGANYVCFGLLETLVGPQLGEPDEWRGPRFVAPSFLATRYPDVVRERFATAGWECLSGWGIVG